MLRTVGFWIVVGVLVVAAGTGWLAFQRYWYYLPGLVASIRNPIEDNHPVVWQQGPAIAPAPAEQRPPNVILILADDLGYNDISLNGGGVAGGLMPTPNIDSIAKDGVTFTNGYAGNATCAPSRAAIMTGRYATRFGFEFTPAPVQFEQLIAKFDYGRHEPIFRDDLVSKVPPVGEQILPLHEITIAQMMKSRGYHTMFLGKWHLGETKEAAPENRGFDETLGFLAGASRYGKPGDANVIDSKQDFDPIDKFLWANLPFAVQRNGGHRFYPSKYMTDYLGSEAVKAIDANRNRPFFMYLAFNAPHTPLQAFAPDYGAGSLVGLEPDRLRVYAAMIRALDRNVGNVLSALKANGLDKNTLVIFTSDNGGANYIGLPDLNKPFRGWKMTFFEGGIHVPYMMKWPARIARHSVYNLPVAHTDIFATAAAAAGVPLPTDRVMDGVDLVPFVTGQRSGAPHRTIFWRSGSYKTLLDGEWKLQVSSNPNVMWLYDLKSDPTEHNNLAATAPDKLKSMLATLALIDKQQHQPLWPSLIEGPIDIDHPLSYAQRDDDSYVYWAN
jgi:arylsulfatase A-like enzyme